MAAHLYVCFPCGRQVQKVYHHKQDVPETIFCPYCGKKIGQFSSTITHPDPNCPPLPLVRAPSGAMKPKISKGRRG